MQSRKAVDASLDCIFAQDIHTHLALGIFIKPDFLCGVLHTQSASSRKWIKHAEMDRN